MIVRPATVDDLEALVATGAGLATLAPHTPFDARGACDSLTQLLSLQNAVAFVAEADGVVIGGIFGIVGVPWSSGSHADLVLTELAWWVDPKHRGVAGVKLLDAFETEAIHRGCIAIAMSTQLSHVEGEIARKVLERRGYSTAETVHVRKL